MEVDSAKSMSRLRPGWTGRNALIIVEGSHRAAHEQERLCAIGMRFGQSIGLVGPRLVLRAREQQHGGDVGDTGVRSEMVRGRAEVLLEEGQRGGARRNFARPGGGAAGERPARRWLRERTDGRR